jgi:WhiB family redox-sensing transcriptional regulator
MPQPQGRAPAVVDDYQPVDLYALIEQLHPAWHAEANCREVETSMMFPHDSKGVDRAKGVCVGCPVQGECREAALAFNQDYGVWGGMSERERRRARGRRSGERGTRSHVGLDIVLADGEWHPLEQVVQLAALSVDVAPGHVRRSLGTYPIERETMEDGSEMVRRCS